MNILQSVKCVVKGFYIVTLPTGIGICGNIAYTMQSMSDHSRAIFVPEGVEIELPSEDIFALLDAFDFAAPLCPVSEHETNGIPNTFPWYNIGIIALKSNGMTRTMLEDWSRECGLDMKHPENHSSESWSKKRQQSALRKVLWRYAVDIHSPMRYYKTCVLPLEYSDRNTCE